MPAPPNTFHLFPQLPAELRLAIWRECLPYRVVELDWQCDEWLFEGGLPCQNNRRTTDINAQPPIITQVCSEARAVAFETGGTVPDSYERDDEAWYPSSRQLHLSEVWFDHARDIIHRNWEPLDDIEYISYGDPLNHLLWITAQTKLNTASIMDAVIFQSRSSPNGGGIAKWSWAQLANMLRRRSGWLLVIGEPVIIHASIKNAGGLFGLLGDACVQLVGIDDRPKIDRFFALSHTPSVTISSNPAKLLGDAGSLALNLENLRKLFTKMFGSEDLFKLMQPVIMFRLCTATSDPTSGGCFSIPQPRRAKP